MTHTFVINTDNVNEYGYRVLTSGIDTSQYEKNPVVLYGHTRAYDDPKRVVGRCVKLWKEDGKLLAEIEFDEADEFAKELAGKVERGFIRMASLYADVIETSIDPLHLLPNQSLETVTKSKLVEISIVDIGGNDEALKLSRNGSPVKLRKINPENNETMSLKTIALALALSANANEEAVLEGVEKLKKEKQDAEARAKTAEDNLKAFQESEASSLVEEAVELGLIPEGTKPAILLAFQTDHETQKKTFTQLIADKRAEASQDAGQAAVKEIILGAKGKATQESETECFDYLQKHNPVELRRIHTEDPEKYAKLAKEYAGGKRYVESKN